MYSCVYFIASRPRNEIMHLKHETITQKQKNVIQSATKGLDRPTIPNVGGTQQTLNKVAGRLIRVHCDSCEFMWFLWNLKSHHGPLVGQWEHGTCRLNSCPEGCWLGSPHLQMGPNSLTAFTCVTSISRALPPRWSYPTRVPQTIHRWPAQCPICYMIDTCPYSTIHNTCYMIEEYKCVQTCRYEKVRSTRAISIVTSKRLRLGW